MYKSKSLTYEIPAKNVDRNLDAIYVISRDLTIRCREYLQTQDDAFVVADNYPGDELWQHKNEISGYFSPVRKQQLREQIRYLRRKLSELSKSIDGFPEIRL